MSKSSTMAASIFLFIALAIPLASSLGPPPSPERLMTETQSQKMAARDAITISIREVREMTKFVDLIPRLKSVQFTFLDPQLLLCVESLVFDLSNIKSTLYRLRHMKHPQLMADTNSLKRMMAQTTGIAKMCSGSLTSVHEIVLSMLNRKLNDLSVVIDDVVYHVTEFERNVYRGV